MKRRPLALALLHHPVCDRNGALVTTAVTNLDLHDIARTARTYGVDRYYVVTPAVEQRRLVETIVAHWREGYGASANPDRGEALRLIEVVADLETAIADWWHACGAEPLPVLTGARCHDGLDSAACRARLREQGIAQAKRFTWREAAEKTLQLYREAFEARR